MQRTKASLAQREVLCEAETEGLLRQHLTVLHKSRQIRTSYCTILQSKIKDF